MNYINQLKRIEKLFPYAERRVAILALLKIILVVFGLVAVLYLNGSIVSYGKIVSAWIMIVLGSTLVVMMLDAFAGDTLKHLSDAEVLVNFPSLHAYSQSLKLWDKKTFVKLPGFAKSWAHRPMPIINKYLVRFTPVKSELSDEIEEHFDRNNNRSVLLVSESLEISRHAVATFSEHLEKYIVSLPIQHMRLVSLDVSGIMRSRTADELKIVIEQILSEAALDGSVILYFDQFASLYYACKNFGFDLILMIDPYLHTGNVEFILGTNVAHFRQIFESHKLLRGRIDSIFYDEF